MAQAPQKQLVNDSLYRFYANRMAEVQANCDVTVACLHSACSKQTQSYLYNAYLQKHLAINQALTQYDLDVIARLTLYHDSIITRKLISSGVITPDSWLFEAVRQHREIDITDQQVLRLFNSSGLPYFIKLGSSFAKFGIICKCFKNLGVIPKCITVVTKPTSFGPEKYLSPN